MAVKDRQYKRDLIRKAFTGDDEIFNLFDPTVHVETTDDVVENILTKIEEYEAMYDCQFDETSSGYVFHVLEPRMLVSFGCEVSKRGAGFWSEILDVMGPEFVCVLWDRNVRAIKWLERNGMKVVHELDNIKVLQLCQ